MARTTLVLANMGGPSSTAEVDGYLRAIFADPAILPVPSLLRGLLGRWITRRRAPAVRERYRRIGGASPLSEWTQRQAEHTAAALEAEGADLSVAFAFRYTAPSLGEVIAAEASTGAERILLLPLFPHHTDAMSGSIEREARRAADAHGLALATIGAWGNRPDVLELYGELLAGALERAGAGARVLFVAHGIPLYNVRRGDDYPDQVAETAHRLAERLGAGVSWSLAYQSRVGPVRWTGPYLEDELERLAASPAPVVLMPLSFVADCLETLYDLDAVAAPRLDRAGVEKVERVQAFNDHPAFGRLIAKMAIQAYEEQAVG